jgi:hypothetical protein
MSIYSNVMDYEKYLQAATEALDELKKLVDQKKAIEADIAKVSNLFMANVNMMPPAIVKAILDTYHSLKPPAGLSDAILRVLSSTDHMATVGVREALIKSGYDLTDQVNALASISTTLKRLSDPKDGRVIAREEEGRTVYKRARLKDLATKAPKFYGR